MPLASGSRLGAYDITGPLGVGGMGEVYRARDSKLGREVAIKVLPEALASDPERIARFEREAQALAALNHPHIAHLHSLEQAIPSPGQPPIPFLVMELVEGETLAERISHVGRVPRSGPADAGSAGPGLQVEEALTIAHQIAQALEAAHEKGIIHRDLKPANVKITPDGQVKVLDFGLAKAMDNVVGVPRSGPAGANEQAMADLTRSPTLSMMATEAGMILGTAAYMSPEQAKGSPADHRSDVFSFGSVLYEMLTGRSPFKGDTAPEILASVLVREVDFAALPPNLNPRLYELLKRCLDKNPKQRWQAVGDLRVEIETIAVAPHAASATAVASARREPLWRRLAFVGAPALIAGAAMAGGAVWFATRPPAPRVMRTTITPAAAAALTINGFDRDLAIAPDGSRIVYVGANGTQLFVRALDTLEPVAVFTGTPRGLFVSPDGQWIGFVDGARSLKKVAMTGGPAVTLATLDGPPRGATWAPDGMMIFATFNTAIGLQRVSAAGGTPEVLTTPDRAQGEADHLWPELLPGGRAVLLTITAVTGGLDAAQVAVLDLETGTRTVLVRGGSHAQYMSSPSTSSGPAGYLVYAAAGTLRAVAFDVDRLETRGTPVPVVPDVVTALLGGVYAVVAADGTLAYVSGGGGAAGAQRTLVWVNRQGQETAIAAPPRAYTYPRIAPDSASVVLWSADQESDIWRWDVARTTLTRLTFDGALDAHPAWTPDGRRLVFSSERAGARNLYWQAADGTGAVERLTESPNSQNGAAVSPDGTRVIFYETGPKTGDDVLQLQLDGTRRVTPLVQTPFAERNGILSPDGGWLAYEANDSGRLEVYVRPFPEVTSGLWQVSTGGGTRPLWARNGQELFYVSPAGALMRVGVERAQSWAATMPTLLIKEGYAADPGGNSGRTYDISPDGQRFLLVKAGDGSGQAAEPPSLIVVQHFDEELKRLVPR